MRTSLVTFAAILASAGVLIGASGCMTAYKRSVGANTQSSFQRVYRTDFNNAWQSTLDAMKSMRLDVTNREAGFLQTRWMDNTKEKNFTDGDGVSAPYMRAQYRFKVSISNGVYRGKSAIKVSVQREQFAQRDALDDFRPLESDSIEENTLLYRIGRLINLRSRLARLEERKTQAEIQRAARDNPAGEAPPDAGATEELPPVPSDDLSSDSTQAGSIGNGGDFVPTPPESE